jgi:hypothetical protein
MSPLEKLWICILTRSDRVYNTPSLASALSGHLAIIAIITSKPSGLHHTQSSTQVTRSSPLAYIIAATSNICLFFSLLFSATLSKKTRPQDNNDDYHHHHQATPTMSLRASLIAAMLTLASGGMALGSRIDAALARTADPLPPSLGASFPHPRRAATSICGGTNHVLCDPSQDTSADVACRDLVLAICDADRLAYGQTAPDATSYTHTLDGKTCQLSWTPAVGAVYLCAAAVEMYNGCTAANGIGGGVSVDVKIQGHCVTQCLGQPGQVCPRQVCEVGGGGGGP